MLVYQRVARFDVDHLRGESHRHPIAILAIAIAQAEKEFPDGSINFVAHTLTSPTVPLDTDGNSLLYIIYVYAIYIYIDLYPYDILYYHKQTCIHNVVYIYFLCIYIYICVLSGELTQNMKGFFLNSQMNCLYRVEFSSGVFSFLRQQGEGHGQPSGPKSQMPQMSKRQLLPTCF